jgi:hypothetical protein
VCGADTINIANITAISEMRIFRLKVENSIIKDIFPPVPHEI